MRILVVEDDTVLAAALTRALGQAAHSVDLVDNGEDADRALKLGSYDLVVLDIALPRMDGWEATLAIKADPELAWTPIVALTAHALESDRRRSVEVGCADFDTKPVDYPRLLEKIERLLLVGAVV